MSDWDQISEKNIRKKTAAAMPLGLHVSGQVKLIILALLVFPTTYIHKCTNPTVTPIITHIAMPISGILTG